MYKKEFYVFDGKIPRKAVIRNYTEKDFGELIRIQKESFPPPFPSDLWWKKEQLTEHVTRFPEGALCIEVEEHLCGSMTGLIVDLHGPAPHTWEEITDNGYIRNHNPEGNTLYIVDICVSPEYRALGLGKLLMQSMYEVVINKNIDRLLGGGRLPGYHRVSDELSPEEYVQKVTDGVLRDPVMTFLMKCGRMPIGIAYNYLEDEESKNCAVLMEWRNPFK